MGFGFKLSKPNNTIKFIQKYVQERVKEKQILHEQLERLNAQLHNDAIDRYTFERLRGVIEINFIRQQDEALEKAFNKM